MVATEIVQERFTRMKGHGYKERLDRLHLFPLEHRRLRDYIIEAYTIMRGIDSRIVSVMFMSEEHI